MSDSPSSQLMWWIWSRELSFHSLSQYSTHNLLSGSYSTWIISANLRSHTLWQSVAPCISFIALLVRHHIMCAKSYVGLHIAANGTASALESWEEHHSGSVGAIDSMVLQYIYKYINFRIQVTSIRHFSWEWEGSTVIKFIDTGWKGKESIASIASD